MGTYKPARQARKRKTKTIYHLLVTLQKFSSSIGKKFLPKVYSNVGHNGAAEENKLNSWAFIIFECYSLPLSYVRITVTSLKLHGN